jgi:hypothetical protein
MCEQPVTGHVCIIPLFNSERAMHSADPLMLLPLLLLVLVYAFTQILKAYRQIMREG